MLHISCNMGTRNLPDMYALSPQACGPRAWAYISGIHIRQITRAYVTTITCTCISVTFTVPEYIPSPSCKEGTTVSYMYSHLVSF